MHWNSDATQKTQMRVVSENFAQSYSCFALFSQIDKFVKFAQVFQFSQYLLLAQFTQFAQFA